VRRSSPVGSTECARPGRSLVAWNTLSVPTDRSSPRNALRALGASGRPRRSLGRVASAPGIAGNRRGPKGGLDLRLRRYRRAAVGEVKVANEPITCEVAQQRKLRIPPAAVAVRATLNFSASHQRTIYSGPLARGHPHSRSTATTHRTRNKLRISPVDGLAMDVECDW
jgi:hypothetical protein